MKLGLIQYDPVWEDIQSNCRKLNSLLEKENSRWDLIIFPEMTLTGFTMNAEKFAEELRGENFKYFSGISEKYNCNVLAGIIEKENGNYFNTLVHLDNKGELKSSYRKIHPFSYSTEDKHYKRGEKAVVTNVNEFNVGLSICYDLRFPELYRQYGKAKADLIVVIANWPVTRIEHWRILLKARAIENQCYVAGVNRVGKDPKLNYSGFSAVYGPMGEELVFEAENEKIISAEISKDRVKEVQSKLPFLDDIYLI